MFFNYKNSDMTKALVLSLLYVYILCMYQINQSLSLTLFHSGDASMLDDRFSLMNEYFQRVIIPTYFQTSTKINFSFLFIFS